MNKSGAKYYQFHDKTKQISADIVRGPQNLKTIPAFLLKLFTNGKIKRKVCQLNCGLLSISELQ